MGNIELYINGQLCDVDKNFSIRINRRFIKPDELNTKDAQYSYSITLPFTENNNKAFDFANIEETKNKFNKLYPAELLINSVQIIKGAFLISSIEKGYRGNLCVPALKSVKDVFGDAKLNEVGEYRLEFKDFVTYVNMYNTNARTAPQPAIFPYTLYGLLPKYPLSNDYSRTEWDDNVRLTIQDFPPSLNLLQLLKKLFELRGYILQGNAFNDDRLTQLYLSYKNEPDYVQPWNYGRYGGLTITGNWASDYNYKTGVARGYEKGVYRNDGVYVCNLFDSTNASIRVVDDKGGNVLLNEKDGWTQCQIRIPVAGYYKIDFEGRMSIPDVTNFNYNDPDTGVRHISVISSADVHNFTQDRMYEFRLLRDWGSGDFGLTSAKLDGTFYYDNQPQPVASEVDTAKYFPRVPESGQINFIDPAQDPNIVAGFSIGLRRGDQNGGYKNPVDLSNRYAQVHVAKPAYSWDIKTSRDKVTRLAVNSPGYWEIITDEENNDTSELTNRYKIELTGQDGTAARRFDDFNGNGQVYAVCWFEAGELLTLASVSEEGRYRESGSSSRYGWTEISWYFYLTLTPFQANPDWLKVDMRGNGTGVMDWNEPSDFDRDSINLLGFLPSDMKADDFIDNVCKAFNLRLSQTGENVFELNVKQTKSTEVSNQFLDLDKIASVREKSNTSLGLPSLYKLGFTIDTEEEGYVESGDDGGGEYSTNAVEEKIVEQKSTFSYNWFKEITKDGVSLPLAVISKAEVWEDNTPYIDAVKKRYTNQALRFWFYDGLLNDLGASFEYRGKELYIAKVSNVLNGRLTLNYKNEALTILDTYFTVLVNSSSHYTEIEGYLTPAMYEALNGSITAMFNGDIYYVGELNGYDPEGRNKTKIKLIRAI